jgi:hypothetical protein
MLCAKLPSGENSVPPSRVIDLRKWCDEERAIDGVTFYASAGDRIDNFARRALFAWMGKRSPHEATCPRIASGSHQGRIMSAAIPTSSDNLSRTTPPIDEVMA